MIPYFPKQFSSRAILLYFSALAVVSIVFYRYMMKLEFFVMGIIWVLLFFLLSYRYTTRWAEFTESKYVRKLFFTALVLRLIWITFSYFYYTVKTGIPFEFGASDSLAYHDASIWFREVGWSKTFDYLQHKSRGDWGYPIYLTFLYMIIGPNIYLTRVIKCLLSSWMCVIVYRMAKRNMGEEVGRMAGIFCCLMPNLIIYCGLHLKETEMIFLTIASLGKADNMLHKGSLKIWDVIIEALLVVSIFLFRSVLGASVVFAIFSALVFTSNRLVGNWNRVVLISWPDADSLGAVLHCLLHGEPLGPRVLGCNHHVDIVAAPDAMVVAGEEAVGVWRKVEAHYVGLLVGYMVQESWILMGESVVVLLPYIGCKDVGER